MPVAEGAVAGGVAVVAQAGGGQGQGFARRARLDVGRQAVLGGLVFELCDIDLGVVVHGLGVSGGRAVKPLGRGFGQGDRWYYPRMPLVSAGLLPDRRAADEAAGLEVLLVHPGGPYWARKQKGAWSIPKGNVERGEDALQAARREFREETGYDVDEVALVTPPQFAPLGGVKYRNHKIVRAWAVEGDCDAGAITSLTFEMEWPPRSGRLQSYPEADKAAWFDLAAAREAVLPAQRRFIDDLEAIVATPGS